MHHAHGRKSYVVRFSMSLSAHSCTKVSYVTSSLVSGTRSSFIHAFMPTPWQATQYRTCSSTCHRITRSAETWAETCSSSYSIQLHMLHNQRSTNRSSSPDACNARASGLPPHPPLRPVPTIRSDLALRDLSSPRSSSPPALSRPSRSAPPVLLQHFPFYNAPAAA